MNKTTAEKIMNWCWGNQYGVTAIRWDINSPAHRFWKREVKKRKRSLIWWKKNYKRIWDEKIKD